MNEGGVEAYADITSVEPVLPLHSVGDWSDELFRQRDEAIAEALVWRKRTVDLTAENARLRERQRRVIELHTDSPAGHCPSCGRVGDVSDEDDGLVPWPCPTILAVDPKVGAR